jgi:hypothetical protein
MIRQQPRRGTMALWPFHERAVNAATVEAFEGSEAGAASNCAPVFFPPK